MSIIKLYTNKSLAADYGKLIIARYRHDSEPDNLETLRSNVRAVERTIVLCNQDIHKHYREHGTLSDLPLAVNGTIKQTLTEILERGLEAMLKEISHMPKEHEVSNYLDTGYTPSSGRRTTVTLSDAEAHFGIFLERDSWD